MAAVMENLAYFAHKFRIYGCFWNEIVQILIILIKYDNVNVI